MKSYCSPAHTSINTTSHVYNLFFERDSHTGGFLECSRDSHAQCIISFLQAMFNLGFMHQFGAGLPQVRLLAAAHSSSHSSDRMTLSDIGDTCKRYFESIELLSPPLIQALHQIKPCTATAGLAPGKAVLRRGGEHRLWHVDASEASPMGAGSAHYLDCCVPRPAGLPGMDDGPHLCAASTLSRCFTFEQHPRDL